MSLSILSRRITNVETQLTNLNVVEKNAPDNSAEVTELKSKVTELDGKLSQCVKQYEDSIVQLKKDFDTSLQKLVKKVETLSKKAPVTPQE
jgi:exonuclease VII small subunit